MLHFFRRLGPESTANPINKLLSIITLVSLHQNNISLTIKKRVSTAESLVELFSCRVQTYTLHNQSCVGCHKKHSQCPEKTQTPKAEVF